jgi:hypothetical protein
LTFSTPLALLALLLVPLLLLLERLRRRPRERLVASLVLWRAVADAARPASHRRPRSLRTLLRVLVVVLLAFAAAAPGWVVAEPRTARLVALVDRSPAMGADGRLERAVAAVREAAEGFDGLRVLFSPPADVVRGVGALSPPPVADAPGDLARDAATLLGLFGGDPGARALLVTDRLPPSLASVPGLAVVLVGRPVENAAITALRIDRDAEGLVAFVAWERFGGDGRAPDLLLEAGGETIRVPGGPGRREAIQRLPGEVTRVEARLDHVGDALGADDRAWASPAAEAPELGLLAKGEIPAAAGTAFRALLGEGLVEGAPGRDGAVVWGDAPPESSPGLWIAVRPDRAWRGFEVLAEETEPVPVPDLRPAPALRPAFPAGLSRDLALAPPGRLTHPPDASVLLRDGEDRPLVAVAADGRAAVLAFDPADPRGGFPSSGAHVVFWRALLDALGAGRTRFVAAGLLDGAESDLRGEERPLPSVRLDARRDGEEPRTVPLRPALAILAVLALAALMLLARPGNAA